MTALQLLALRIVLGLHTPTLAQIRELQAAGYRGWVRGECERRILPSNEHPDGEGWTRVDVSIFGVETWQVERDSRLIPGEHDIRENAIFAAWADAASLVRVTGSQIVAMMARPPRGYAVVLVAGTTQGPARLGSWDECTASRRHTT